MKTLLHLFIIISVYLCSFNELAQTASLSNFNLITQAKAGFSVPNCVSEIEDQAICEGIKETYQKCISDGNDQSECEDMANQTVDQTQNAELQEQMAELQSLSSLDSASQELFIQICIIIVSEIISGYSRVNIAPRSGSAWMHFLASCLLLLYFVIATISFEKWGIAGLKKDESLYGSYADKLTARQSTDQNAKEGQIEMINQQIQQMDSLSSVYYAHTWALGIAAGIFTLAAGIAVWEVFQCASNAITWGLSGGCTNIHKPNERYYVINKVLSILAPQSKANEGEGEGEDEDEALEVETGSYGEISPNSSWWTTGIASITTTIFGPIGTTVVGWINGATITKTSSKVVPIIRVAAFVLSSVSMIIITTKFSQVKSQYDQRSLALENLKGNLELAIAAPTTTQAGVNNRGGNSLEDQRGLSVGYGNENLDFIKDQCASGNLNNVDVTADSSCKKGKGVTLDMPKFKIGQLDGFNTAGLDATHDEIAEGLVALAKGNPSKLNNSSVANMAAVKKALGGLVDRLRKNPISDENGPIDFDQVLKDESAIRASRMKELLSSLPKSSFDQLVATSPVIKEDQNNEGEKDISKKNKNSKDTEESTNKKSEQYINFGGIQNDEISTDKALSDVKFENNDIVKKPGVSIWKVLNVRYQKSAWRRLLNKKKSK